MSRKKVLVSNDIRYARAIEGLCIPTSDVDDFFKNTSDYELVLFTGGADISPEYYGDVSPFNLCMTSPARDKKEKRIFDHALKHGIKMTGICRGVQLLTAMCGGKLIHHLDGHEGTHHTFQCTKTDEIISVNSLHHQMCIPPADGYVVGWSEDKKSEIYYGDGDTEVEWHGPEVEAVIMPTQKCAGVQYHPEMMSKDTKGYQWFYIFMFDFLDMEMDEFVKVYTKGKNNDLKFNATN